MAVTYGYLRNTDDASIGSVVRVPHLKEVGLYPKTKEKESIEVFSHTLLEEVAKRLSLA